VVASPFAKKVAGEQGINLSGLAGSGPNGRIIHADLANAKPAGSAAAAPAAPSILSDFGDFEDVPTTQIRRVIADRLSFSKQTIPHYYVSIDVEVDRLLALRAKLNKHSASKISVNDMIIKASSLAALKVPETNSSWQQDYIRVYKNVDMSVAVQTDHGLLTPIVKYANLKGL
jgi:pyruvate dehydrogenase E2 component (dihydrolipoamide acetyltransferase)